MQHQQHSEPLPAYLTRGRRRAARRRFLLRSGAAGLAALAVPPLLAGRAGAEQSDASSPQLPAYVSRGGWGADEDLRFDDAGEVLWPVEFWPVQAVTVHHTGGYSTGDGASAAEVIQQIYADHAVARGYGDIGYHLLIDPDGIVYEGRYSGGTRFPLYDRWPDAAAPSPRLVTGAHVYNHNVGNVGVAVLADLDAEEVSDAAWWSLQVVVARILGAAGLDPLAVVHYSNPINGLEMDVPALGGHRDWDRTDCPGTLARWLGDLRNGGRDLIGLLPADAWLR